MAIKKRTPEATRFVNGVDEFSGTSLKLDSVVVDLKTLSLDDLADRADAIAKQSYDMLGLICLEARQRFPSNGEFGQWRKSVEGLSSYSPQHITDLMNRARFAITHDMTGISLSAGFEISAPVNSDVAEDVWKYCKGKNLTVQEVKNQIAKRKPTNIIPERVAPVLEKSPGELQTLHLKTKIDVVNNVAQIETEEQETNADDLARDAVDAIIDKVSIGNGIPVTDEEYENSLPTYIDYEFEMDRYAQNIGMSDLVGIKVYTSLIRKLQMRLYKK